MSVFLEVPEEAWVFANTSRLYPWNWLPAPDGRLTAVFDFVHARWDLRAADPSQEFLRHPRLVDAFYSGYGEPDDRLAQQIETFRLFTNVVSAVSAACRTSTASRERSPDQRINADGRAGIDSTDRGRATAARRPLPTGESPDEVLAAHAAFQHD